MDDYDWYYEIYPHDYSAAAPGKCYGCGDRIEPRDEVKHIHEYQFDIDNEEENHRLLGRICEKCDGHYAALTELGYCISADFGFIAAAMDEYRSMLPEKNKTLKPGDK